MDPSNIAVIARLRTESSITMKIHKRQCERIQDDFDPNTTDMDPNTTAEYRDPNTTTELARLRLETLTVTLAPLLGT